ncbi:MAG: 50S ribosomal protein L21 [Candidatus Margulisbacteria bacterium]|nr:50S ribosomal protein L21 [Candidatus Margulisiibacteriota bacterium]MBU1021832.1 50S ribosomal protein L21 [Candidatus Margulisiibacteriota bacterium]MBU1728991.1 50S ribosomal protein L21 [Candidatus Margulisiibacteriota bacterium]MBU1954456.1 50S ribosomal protein L21 [Candidatus Margulisiibacteriota bacterium]
MYAVIETGGKQYRVEKDDIIDIETLEGAEKDKPVTFDQILLVVDGENIKVGTPTLNGANVSAKFIENGKGDKVTTFKYKNKIKYRRTKGHRQPYTRVQIETIKS